MQVLPGRETHHHGMGEEHARSGGHPDQDAVGSAPLSPVLPILLAQEALGEDVLQRR